MLLHRFASRQGATRIKGPLLSPAVLALRVLELGVEVEKKVQLESDLWLVPWRPSLSAMP